MASAWAGSGLAAAALVAGYAAYGWRGLVLALSVIVFWLLLQFSRSLRLLRQAAQAPVGHVESAVMLQSRLSVGMRLADAIKIAGSLGQKLRDEPETWVWRDAGGVALQVEFDNRGRCGRWTLVRPIEQP